MSSRRRSSRATGFHRYARWPPFDLPRLPKLEQRTLDVIAFGLIALAVFLAAVFYFGWDGGKLGTAIADGLVLLAGRVAWAVPVVLIGMAALLMFGGMLPSTRPVKAGAVCLILAALLGFAAGSLGLGGVHPVRTADFMGSGFYKLHGGIAGEAIYWSATTLLSKIGAQILFAFLVASGLLLLTGITVAGIARSAHERAAATTERMRRSSEDLAAVFRGRPTAREPAFAHVTQPLHEDSDQPHEEEDDDDRIAEDRPPDVEPVVRATHVEAPALDGAQRYPDLFDKGATREAKETEPEEFDPKPEDGRDTSEIDALESESHRQEPEPDDAEPAQEELTPQGNRRSDVTESDDVDYRLPNPKLLKRSSTRAKVDTRGQEKVGQKLVEALGHFGVESKIVGTVAGPHVTRYELRLAPGTKMAKVSQLKDDLAYALAATDVRILAPIPGKQAVGVEVPNEKRRDVHLGDVFQEAPKGWSPLTVWLGKDIAGRAIGADLAKQPHILVAGTTGSGKSVSINSMLASVLLRASPNDMRLVLVDPKQVELNHYDDIPHLLTPVVTSPRMAANVLQNLIKEMEARYSLMNRARTRSLHELNVWRRREGEPTLPYVLCVIDELADLMMIAPTEVEDAVIRLAQKSRAVGIHLLLATQRPSADVITGMIKANVPARIAFAVSSQVDSRVILDQNGAESLLGYGDMLFRPASESRLARIQGAFITEDEIERLCDHWRRQGTPEMREDLLEAVEPEEGEDGPDDFDPDADDLLPDAMALVVQMGTASTSMLQRRLRVGYTRAGRLIDMMERRGVISGYEGSKARQVLISEGDLPRVLATLEEPGAPVGAGADDLRQAGRRARARPAVRQNKWLWARLATRCAKRGSASRSTSQRSRSGPRSAPSTCARLRTRSSSSSLGAPSCAASCAPTRSTSASIPTCCSRSSACSTSRARRSSKTYSGSAARSRAPAAAIRAGSSGANRDTGRTRLAAARSLSWPPWRWLPFC
jgi:DNA segregation ATPase FtsK/SpoIIIE, S-DNA-T family